MKQREPSSGKPSKRFREVPDETDGDPPFSVLSSSPALDGPHEMASAIDPEDGAPVRRRRSQRGASGVAQEAEEAVVETLLEGEAEKDARQAASQARRRQMLFLPDNDAFTFDFTAEGEEEEDEDENEEEEETTDASVRTPRKQKSRSSSSEVEEKEERSGEAHTSDQKEGVERRGKGEKEEGENDASDPQLGVSSSSSSLSSAVRRSVPLVTVCSAEEVERCREAALSHSVAHYLRIPLLPVRNGADVAVSSSSSRRTPSSRPRDGALVFSPLTSSSSPSSPPAPPSHLTENGKKKWWRRWKREQILKQKEEAGLSFSAEQDGAPFPLDDAIACFQRGLQKYEAHLWWERKQRSGKQNIGDAGSRAGGVGGGHGGSFSHSKNHHTRPTPTVTPGKRTFAFA